MPAGDFDIDCVESIDQLGENGHLNNTEVSIPSVVLNLGGFAPQGTFGRV